MQPSLYIHIPFCEKKCFYCSFVVSVGHDEWIEPYLEALAKEVQAHRDRSFHTIYLGGGTPNYLNLKQLEILLSLLKNNFHFPKDYEWTVELNPEGLTSEKMQLLQDFGINRVSLGVQTLNDRYLKYLGRCHKAQTAVDSFDRLRKAGFTNINVDLMYSFPGQTDLEIADDLKQILALDSEHLSLYTLTIDEKSRFYVQRVQLESNNIRSQQYEAVVQTLEKSAFQQYEVSNFAKPKKESLHNLNYWRGGNYLGLGVGAHSHWNGKRFWNADQTPRYIQQLNEGKSPQAGEEVLIPTQRLMESLLIGLRMNRGVNIAELENSYAISLESQRRELIEDLIHEGFLIKEQDRLRTTLKGRLVLDEIGARLI